MGNLSAKAPPGMEALRAYRQERLQGLGQVKACQRRSAKREGAPYVLALKTRLDPSRAGGR